MTATLDLSGLKQRITDFGMRKEDEAEYLLAVVVLEGVAMVRQNLLDAHTWTGRNRAANDEGLPGRYVTGALYDAVDANQEQPVREGTALYMAFGWFADNMQPYFMQQEKGDPSLHIPAAHALPPAELEAIGTLKYLLERWQYETVDVEPSL